MRPTTRSESGTRFKSEEISDDPSQVLATTPLALAQQTSHAAVASAIRRVESRQAPSILAFAPALAGVAMHQQVNSSFLPIDQLARQYAISLAAAGGLATPSGIECPQTTVVGVDIRLVHRLLPPELLRDSILIPVAKSVITKLRGARIGGLLMPAPAGALEHFAYKFPTSARHSWRGIACWAAVLPRAEGGEQVITQLGVVHENIPEVQ